ncbi:MAG: hypothetical protein AAF602_12120 [Myxococcota bacterium]
MGYSLANGVMVRTKAIMVVGGEPGVNAWVRDGLAAAPQTFVLPLEPVHLPPTETGTPPQSVRRLLNPSFATAVRQSSSDGMLATLRNALSQTMHAGLGHRPVVGVPEGLGFAEWLADECDCRIVCLASHPLSVAAHYKQMFSRDDSERWIDRACREWLVASEWIAGYRERRRDFAFAWDDELIGEPFVGFHRLYRQLGLSWSNRSQIAIGALLDEPSSASCTVRPDAWRDALTDDEVERVRATTERRPAPVWPPQASSEPCHRSEVG